MFNVFGHRSAHARVCRAWRLAQICAEVGRRFTQEQVRHVADPLANLLVTSGITCFVRAAETLQSRTGPAPTAVPLDVLPDDETDDDE